MRTRLLLLALLVAVVPAAAHAEPAAASSAPPRADRYVGTMALASTVPLALAAVSVYMDEPSMPLFVGSGIAFTVAGPVVHQLHGQSVARTAGSFLLRVGLPLGGLLIGKAYQDSCEECDYEQFSPTTTGFVLGMGAALASDLAFAAVPRPRNARPSSNVQPMLGARPGGLSIGLAGTF